MHDGVRDQVRPCATPSMRGHGTDGVSADALRAKREGGPRRACTDQVGRGLTFLIVSCRNADRKQHSSRVLWVTEVLILGSHAANEARVNRELGAVAAARPPACAKACYGGWRGRAERSFGSLLGTSEPTSTETKPVANLRAIGPAIEASLMTVHKPPANERLLRPCSRNANANRGLRSD